MDNVTGEVLGAWVTSFSYFLGAVMSVSLLGLYLLFAVLVVRQTILLNSLLETRASLVLKPLAYLHFIFALLIFVLSLIYLRQYLPIP